MKGLEACPFCREVLPEGEATECAVCGVALIPASQLVAASPTDEDGVPHAPDDEVLPWTYLGRGRGLLVTIAILGLVAFVLPWVHATTPSRYVLSGLDLAKERTGFMWSVGVGWFTMLPLVLSRRTIRKMRGARLAVAMLAAIPAISVATLLMNTPTAPVAHGITVQLRYTWDPAVFVTMGLGIVGSIFAALRFGGRVDDIRLTKGSGANHTLH